MIYAKRRFHITFGLHRFTITLAVDLRMNRKKICFELAIGWLFGDIRILAKAKCSVRYIHEWKTKEYVKRVFFYFFFTLLSCTHSDCVDENDLREKKKEQTGNLTTFHKNASDGDVTSAAQMRAEKTERNL